MQKNKSELRDRFMLLLALAIVLGLSACQGQGSAPETPEPFTPLDPNYYDQSWLTGKPCAAPCWYGLEPGVSTRKSINRVEQLPFVDRSSMDITNHFDFVDVGFSYKRSQGFGGLGMIFKHDVLDSVYIQPNYRITFDQAVEKLGAPDGYWIRPIYPKSHGCRLLVVWKNKRIMLSEQEGEMGWFSLQEDLCTKIHDRNGKLPENMVIKSVEIDSPDGIKALINSDFFRPWEGFAR